jgi:acetyl esterase/lipase
VTATVARSRLPYGRLRPQVGDLWRPASRAGDLPVVVLIHGGYWRAQYTKRLMAGLAASVTARGWVAWNIEYRRVGALGGGGGWPATPADVATAIDHLSQVRGVDLGRVAVCGHSAGGQLALWAAGSRSFGNGPPRQPPRVPLCAAVSLAGLVDLDEAARDGLGNGAVPRFLGGDPEKVPDRYRAGSPAALLPLGVPQLVVHGLVDMTVPASMSEQYARCARQAGDEATYLPFPRLNHLDMINPKRGAWAAVVSGLQPLLDR